MRNHGNENVKIEIPLLIKKEISTKKSIKASVVLKVYIT